MKRPLALLLACILLLTTFAGCGKKKPGAKADDTAEYEALYAPVLKKYKQAFEEEWPREKFLETGLAPNLAGLEKTAEPSFAFLDLNNDKTPELFIGRADEAATVYDLYTADGESIKQLTDTAKEPVLTLTDDNRLVDEIDDYESLEVTTFYKMDDDSLTPTDSYIHDAGMIIDGMDAWYHATGELPKSESEFYAEDMDVISKDDYDRGATGYTEAKLAMKEFAELVLPDNVEDLDLSPEARAKTLYAPVIEMYREAFAKGLDMGELLEKNYEVNYFGDSPVFMPIRSPDFSICYLFSYGSVDDSGYMFQDLDNDGNPEMITGRTTSDDNSILDLFTIKDGVPVKTIQSFERNLLYLCTDGRIARYNHGGYDTNTMEFYEYKNGALHFVEVYFQDSGECFHATAETVSDSSKQQPITKEALEKAYDIDKVKLTLTPFSAEEPASEPENDNTMIPTEGTPPVDNNVYHVGDTFEFGSYPQSEVSETTALKAAADAAVWKSYKYYSGTEYSGHPTGWVEGSSWDTSVNGSTKSDDYMKFADFFCDGEKYRAVVFSQYRPAITTSQATSEHSYQDDNGYTVNHVYYFRYEPLKWRVLDPVSGLVMCTSIIDAQAFQNIVFYKSKNDNYRDSCYQDKKYINPANKYSTSDIRDWLNHDFYETAFTKHQKEQIQFIENDSYDSPVGKIFPLSDSEVRNPDYGFSPEWHEDSARILQPPSDYARCQGLDLREDWLLRCEGLHAKDSCGVFATGEVHEVNTVYDTSSGICPAMNLSVVKMDPTISINLYSTHS
ncbi:MAG: hypothetical protein IJL52_00560 [Clostridia bacterium]|nr:hypothetical protein [Clostridia bacterium]